MSEKGKEPDIWQVLEAINRGIERLVNEAINGGVQGDSMSKNGRTISVTPQQTNLVDAGEWRVDVVDHDKNDAVETHDRLSFHEMLTLMIMPLGPTLNRNKSVTLNAYHLGIFRMKLEIVPAGRGVGN